jgi:hypothetical protein
MPYICLARNDIPDGTLQVTDLWPNTSLRNNSIDPPGQTRYINRLQNDALTLTNNAGVVTAQATAINGLSAYLADTVAPGGTQAASETVQTTGVLVGDSITLGGVAFTAVENTAIGSITVADPTAAVGRLTLGLVPFDCVEGASTGVGLTPATVLVADAVTIAGVLFTAAGAADIPNQVFDQSGGDQATSDSLVLAINHANGQAALTAALDALVAVPTAGTLTATNVGGTVVAITLTPSVLGLWGDAAIVQTVGGATLTPVSLTHTDPVAANQEFGSALHYEGQNADVSILVASSIVATLNDAASTALINAAYAGPPPAALDGNMTGANGGTFIVTLTASLPGFSGALDTTTTEAGQLVLSGANLTLSAPVAANQEFGSLIQMSTDILTAGSIVTTMTDAASDALLIANALGGSSVTVVNGGTDTATITADTAGPVGAMPITEDTGAARLILGDATNRLDRAYEVWTSAHMAAAATAIIAILDAGTAMNEAAINGAINGVAGVSGADVVSVSGSSTVLDILSILAGRGYRVPASSQFASAGGRWESALAPVGSFTDTVSIFDTQMLGGELRPALPFTKLPNNHARSQVNNVQGAAGNSTQAVNFKGVRYNVDGDAIQASLQSGQLSRMQDSSVSMFTDNTYSAFKGDATGFANFSQPGPQTAQVNNARLVTVYDDDGTLL